MAERRQSNLTTEMIESKLDELGHAGLDQAKNRTESLRKVTQFFNQFKSETKKKVQETKQRSAAKTEAMTNSQPLHKNRADRRAISMPAVELKDGKAVPKSSKKKGAGKAASPKEVGSKSHQDGPRGGRYYMSANGKKVYVKRNK